MKRIIITESQAKRLLFEGDNTNGVLDKVWIAYGSSSEFDPNKTKPIEQLYYYNNKPMGGIWACPIDADYQWYEHISTHDMIHFGDSSFGDFTPREHFCFKLKPTAKIFVIDNKDDYNEVSDMIWNVKLHQANRLQDILANKPDSKFSNGTPYQDQIGYLRRSASEDFSQRNNPLITSLETYYNRAIDYYAMIEYGYDGIYVTQEAIFTMKELRHFDVESICVFNNDVIIPVKESEEEYRLKHNEAIEYYLNLLMSEYYDLQIKYNKAINDSEMSEDDIDGLRYHMHDIEIKLAKTKELLKK